MNSTIEWLLPTVELTEITERTILESTCGKYFVTCSVYLNGGMDAYSDRYIAEHREDNKCLWFSRHRTERAAIKAAEKRSRAVERGLPKSRKRRTRKDLVIKRKKT